MYELTIHNKTSLVLLNLTASCRLYECCQYGEIQINRECMILTNPSSSFIFSASKPSILSLKEVQQPPSYFSRLLLHHIMSAVLNYPTRNITRQLLHRHEQILAHTTIPTQRKSWHLQFLFCHRLDLHTASCNIPVIRKAIAHSTGSSIALNISIPLYPRDPIRMHSLMVKQPVQKLPLFAPNQYFRQVRQSVERKLPELQVRLLRQREREKGAGPDNRRIENRDGLDGFGELCSPGVGDPCSDIVADEVIGA